MDPGFNALMDQMRAASMELQEDLNRRRTLAAEALERAENVLHDSAAIVAGMGAELELLDQQVQNLRLAISTHREWIRAGIDPELVNENLWKLLDD